MQNIVAWASTIAGIGFLFDYLEKAVNNEPRKRLAEWIIGFPKKPITKLFQEIATIFTTLLLIIYQTKSQKCSQYIWTGLSTAFYSILIISIFKFFFNSNPCKPEHLMFVATTMIIPGVVLAYLDDQDLLNLLKWKAIVTNSIVPIISVALLALFRRLSIDLNLIEQLILLSTSIAAGFITNRFLRNKTLISPLKVFISTFIAILIVCLIIVNNLDWEYHYKEFMNNPLTISYIGLNIFADAFSLIETYILLRIAMRASIAKMVLFCAIDFILTTCIFLILPLATGSLHLVVNSIFFTGSQPWIGILFWSTFFTSVAFYLFIISAIVLLSINKALCLIVKLSSILPLHKKPFRSLGVIAMMVATFGFVLHWIF